MSVSTGVAPLPQGSPLNASTLLNDHDGLKALNLLPGTEKKTLKGPIRQSFLQYKAQKYNDQVSSRKHEMREETLAELREFSEQYNAMTKPKTPKSDIRSPMQQSGSSSSHSTDDAAFGSIHELDKKTLRSYKEDTVMYRSHADDSRKTRTWRDESLAKLKEFSESFSIDKLKTPKSESKSPFPSSFATALLDDAGVGSQPTESESVDLASQDAAMQRELTPLKIEPTDVDDELGEGDSGPGLNPHARPFNPGQFTTMELIPNVPSESEGSCVDPRPPSTRPETPVEKEDEDYPPLQPRQPPQTQQPIMTESQPMVLIRQQPPPPPPRVVTPPPPPAVQEMPPPMMIPMIRPPHRPTRGSSSPAGRRTPHQPIQDTQMMMNNPPMLLHSDSSHSQGSGPPMHSNGPPPQMVPMMPTMSGPMPMMPQQIPYPYPEGRVPVFFPYHGHMTPVQPQAPGQNPPQDQMPQMVYPAYYPAAPMSQYPMTYPPQMIPPGLPQHYMPVAHTPMTPRPSQQRPRPNRRKSFLNYGSRRG